MKDLEKSRAKWLKFYISLHRIYHELEGQHVKPHFVHCLLYHHCIVLRVGGLLQRQSESSQVLLYLLDERAVPLHESIQSRDSGPLLHLQVGQGNPQVLIQDSLDLLIFLYYTLPYH